MARKTHDVVVTLGTYKNKAGEEKKRYSTIGSAFVDDHGRMSIKLDTIPIGPGWSGWLSLYEPRQDGQQPQGQQARRQPDPEMAGTCFDEDREIPF